MRTNAFLLIAAAGTALGAEVTAPALRTAFAGDFLIGVALSNPEVDGRREAGGRLAAEQFSALTPENAMKWQSLHPEPNRYAFDAADKYVAFARGHNLQLIGHTLVWHSQTPAWVFADDTGKPVTRDVLLKRMREHIFAVVGRYRGKVKGWDVVNEALSDRGTDPLRDSPWRRIIGDDFLDQAFRFAHEADPEAELYYNDYGLEDERKRANGVALVRGMLARGVPIHGVGTQSHFHLHYPSLDAVEKTIAALAGLGIKVIVSELDVDVLPSSNKSGIADINRREARDPALDPYRAELPAPIQEAQAKRYTDLFAIYLRHRDAIARVTIWGLDDGHSWLNNFPIPGRTNHPLLFNRDLQPKPAFFALLHTARESPPPAKR